MSIDSSRAGLNTLCVHAGSQRDLAVGAVNTPVHASSSFLYPNPHAPRDAPAMRYPRYMNIPVQRAVAEKMAALEQAEAAMALSTGMAAVSAPLLGLCQQGDHVVLQADLYGGTHHLALHELDRHGVAHTLVPSSEPADLEAALRENTRLLYLESPTNPLLRVVDLAAVAAMARRCGVLTAIDNTFASPINQNPIALGFDVVIHSGTKYLGGHSDLACGVVCGAGEVFDRMAKWAIAVGCTLGAQDCALLERSLKTLGLRMERHNANGLALARWLEAHPLVARVHHPGLESHPGHAIAARQMRGFGAMLSFEPRLTAERTMAMLQALRLITPAVSLGGVESLVTMPCQTSHVKMTPQQREAIGVTDTLVRFSVGIEDPEDLMADLDQALRAAA